MKIRPTKAEDAEAFAIVLIYYNGWSGIMKTVKDADYNEIGLPINKEALRLRFSFTCEYVRKRDIVRRKRKLKFTAILRLSAVNPT